MVHQVLCSKSRYEAGFLLPDERFDTTFDTMGARTILHLLEQICVWCFVTWRFCLPCVVHSATRLWIYLDNSTYHTSIVQRYRVPLCGLNASPNISGRPSLIADYGSNLTPSAERTWARFLTPFSRRARIII